LSLTTVNKYKKRVFAKMGVDSLLGLIRYAIAHNIDVFQN
jgi:DNA-binding CsgD family transcriptional regulator